MNALAELIASVLVRLLFATHEEAPRLVSDEAKRRANAQADAIANARRRLE